MANLDVAWSWNDTHRSEILCCFPQGFKLLLPGNWVGVANFFFHLNPGFNPGLDEVGKKHVLQTIIFQYKVVDKEEDGEEKEEDGEEKEEDGEEKEEDGEEKEEDGEEKEEDGQVRKKQRVTES